MLRPDTVAFFIGDFPELTGHPATFNFPVFRTFFAFHNRIGRQRNQNGLRLLGLDVFPGHGRPVDNPMQRAAAGVFLKRFIKKTVFLLKISSNRGVVFVENPDRICRSIDNGKQRILFFVGGIDARQDVSLSVINTIGF
jgi:hypothetical protein